MSSQALRGIARVLELLQRGILGGSVLADAFRSRSGPSLGGRGRIEDEQHFDSEAPSLEPSSTLTQATQQVQAQHPTLAERSLSVVRGVPRQSRGRSSGNRQQAKSKAKAKSKGKSVRQRANAR